jgi:hypothetical protein
LHFLELHFQIAGPFSAFSRFDDVNWGVIGSTSTLTTTKDRKNDIVSGKGSDASVSCGFWGQAYRE